MGVFLKNLCGEMQKNNYLQSKSVHKNNIKRTKTVCKAGKNLILRITLPLSQQVSHQ